MQDKYWHMGEWKDYPKTQYNSKTTMSKEYEDWQMVLENCIYTTLLRVSERVGAEEREQIKDAIIEKFSKEAFQGLSNPEIKAIKAQAFEEGYNEGFKKGDATQMEMRLCDQIKGYQPKTIKDTVNPYKSDNNPIN